MSKELIVSSGRHETRVAILEDDQVVELFHEREKEYSLAGSIHKGRVTRVLPGMQSAFVDIGLERDAFLYVSDFFEDNEEYDAVVSGVEEKILKMEKGEKSAETPDSLYTPIDISDVIVASVTAPAVTEQRESRPDHRGSERGADRGGRGNRPPQADRPAGDRAPQGDRPGGDGANRRGRRRRGGRGPGGLPDSKFYSPRDEQATTASGDEESVASESMSEEIHIPTFSRVSAMEDDFTVLPGESLAKYSEPVEAVKTEPEVELPAMEEVATRHFDVVDVEVVDVELIEAAPVAGEPVLEPVAAAEAEPVFEPEPIDEPPVVPAIIAEPDPIVSGPVVSGPVVSEPAEADLAIEEISPSAEFESEAELELEGEALEAEVAEASGDEVVIDHEGPEPARIPTSLTAALREQGHRYPHRVSRRMRRKMRGDEPRQDGDRQPGIEGEAPPVETADGNVAEVAAAEGQTVEVRAEQPAREQRTDRGDRPPRNERRPENRATLENRTEAPVEATGEARPESGGENRGGRGDNRGGRGDNRGGRGEARGEARGGRDRSEYERNERGERVAVEKTERPDRERPILPSIADLLKEGQEIIVQIAKEPLGQKGARITSHIALPGRFVVYMPTVDHVGVSRKIPSDEERHRLKRVLQTHKQGIPGGFICRTAAADKTEEELKQDMHFLYNLWLDMRAKAEKKPAPLLLHADLDLVERVLRDQLTSSFKTIWVDNETYYESILRFVQRFQPALVSRVKLYTRSTPIFDEFGVTNEVEKALRPKVWLKSGGYIVINQTEALVAIDINTGKYVGKSNRLEDTIVKINTDAIKEIVRQIRLRDLGGIIVVDFIDMDERKNRQKVMLALEEAMRADRAPYKILQFNDFGLVAITRKRVKQSLERTLCSPCSYCEGAGYIKSVGTVITEILQEAHRIRKAVDTDDVTLRVNPEVARVLKSNQNTYLQELEEILGKTVMIKNDPLLHQTKFDLA